MVESTRAETEEERVEEIEEQEQRKRKSGQRIRRLLTNFINRYLRGIQSREFQQIAGFEVILQNYIIFAHLLWQLFAKTWVEQEFLVDALVRIWKFFWGNQTDTGYFWRLDLDQRLQGLKWFNEYSSDAELLAALCYSAHLARLGRWEPLLFALRDIEQNILLHPPFTVNKQAFKKAARSLSVLRMYDIPSFTWIVNELASLADFETGDSLTKKIEKKFDLPEKSCGFDKQSVYRDQFHQAVLIDVLTINSADALSTFDMGLHVLQEWMRAESLDYYRIFCPANGRLLFYDKGSRSGTYWARDLAHEPRDFGTIELSPRPWDSILAEMRSVASEIEPSRKPR